MIKIFTAFQYIDIENYNRDGDEIKISDVLIDILDSIISLEIAMFHMRNTNRPKYCDGYNIDMIRLLRGSFISKLKDEFNIEYTNHNDFGD